MKCGYFTAMWNKRHCEASKQEPLPTISSPSKKGNVASCVYIVGLGSCPLLKTPNDRFRHIFLPSRPTEGNN